MGVVSPYGIGVPVFWENLIQNRSAIREIEHPRYRKFAAVGGRVPAFNPKDYLDNKVIRRTDYFSQLALIAAEEAFVDAGLIEKRGGQLNSGVNADRIGTAIGSAFGGIQTLEDAVYDLADGNTRVGPRMISKAIPNGAAAAVNINYGLRGPSMTYVTACAAGANAIGESEYWFWRDDVDYVLAGGADSLFSTVFLSGLGDAGALAKTGPDDLTAWSRPFDKNRTGMIMGEGAAFFVLETLEHAKKRGARIYAELAGYGASNDAYHDTSPDPNGAGAVLAIQRALKAANLGPADIDYVNAHATSTPAGDVAETKVLQQVFGEKLDAIPVSSIKGAIGHLLGAAGAIESAACIKAIEHQLLPATLHNEEKDEIAPKDIVPNKSRPAKLNTVMSNSFGFGGQNGILIWKKYE